MSKPQQISAPFRTIIHNADNSGCCHYRLKFPAWSVETHTSDVDVIFSRKSIPIPEFYQDVRMVRVQRQISGPQMQLFLNFFRPLSNRYGFWLAYEIDDVIGMDDIPKYNSGWPAFQDPQLMQNLKLILQHTDILTVTTEELANYYVKKFDCAREKVYVAPNYLPRWWMGNSYDETKVEARYDSLKNRKPKIAFVSSSTHFDLHNNNGGIDDFTHIIPLIKDTKDKYEWIFIGGYPLQLEEEIKKAEIKFHPGFDILNYAQIINKINPDLTVAPLQDNIFNRCKSNIKFLEMSALGIPCLCQDLVTYKKYTDLRFDASNDLQNLIDETLSSKEKYTNITKHNYDIIENGDSNSPNGYWLEKNLDVWLKLFRIPQRAMMLDFSKLDKAQLAPVQASDPLRTIKFEV